MTGSVRGLQLACAIYGAPETVSDASEAHRSSISDTASTLQTSGKTQPLPLPRGLSGNTVVHQLFETEPQGRIIRRGTSPGGGFEFAMG